MTRVEIKAIDPPKGVVDAMKKQMRAERSKRAAILTAEGCGSPKSLTAEGEKQSSILRAEGQPQAIGTVPGGASQRCRPQLPAYQYLQTLPQLAQAQGNTFSVIPSEMTTALKTPSSAFGDSASPPAAPQPKPSPGPVE